MEKLVAHHSITVKEYDTGLVRTEFNRLDIPTRRMTCESMNDYEQSDRTPLTTSELLLMAAAERVARQLGYEVELPW